MPKINVFIENIYADFNLNDVLVQNNAIKIANYIFDDENIMSESCLAGYNYKTVDFDIVFVNNEEIQRINKEYRKKDSPTDVITFAMFADSKEDERFILEGSISLGEIIVSLDKIKEQSEENFVSFNDELYFIISHGILHLLGFDHLTQQDYEFMVETQNKAKAVINDKI
ncbi:MAG: rRNA maturation RNase YbeY [Candidatus Gastranaerophilales bacterium]|nr:rRNA maturation RNase YbeY [Candidatus Gastranaerophilales bacterium]